MEKDNKLSKTIGYVVGTIVALITYYAIQKALFSPLTFDTVLVQTANEVNKNCPMQIDQETQLDNVVALPDNTFQYNYSMLTFE